LEKRLLGKTDIQVSRLGLGCVTFGREIDEVASSRLMSAALDFGVTLIDTAEAYGGGQARQYRRNTLGVDDIREASSEMHSSEKIIGRWLKASSNRSRVVLQTKVTTNFTRQHVRETIDASLERLQTDWIDLYLFHSFDTETPLEEGLEAFTRAVEQGKIRVAGCSNFSAAQVREALALSRNRGLQRLEEIQPPYSLVERSIESDFYRCVPKSRSRLFPTVPWVQDF
jgi:aryl-alcohol dehydrogenase-like predicted oxidoreductase